MKPAPKSDVLNSRLPPMDDQGPLAVDELIGSITHASDDTDKTVLLEHLSFISEL